ncbi:replication-relaxation family protein [Kitasatospora sp. NPDC057542]|uniref:replication-relaxation family protein n=1 Tax=Kitasatospora sp. NPDC057542 TaxID=3346162 RepID=UPI0036AD040D
MKQPSRSAGRTGLRPLVPVDRHRRAQPGGGGAGRSGAPHAMAVNETVLAFVLGGTVPGAAGRMGRVRSWSTETEVLLPGGKRKVRPDGVWQAPAIGVPVLMVEVDRSTMAPARVAAKFTAYRELFHVKVRDNDPALAGEEPADRTVYWWRRAREQAEREANRPACTRCSAKLTDAEWDRARWGDRLCTVICTFLSSLIAVLVTAIKESEVDLRHELMEGRSQLPCVSAVLEIGEAHPPYVLLNGLAAEVEPVTAYLRDLAPSDSSPLTARSDGFGMLRWFRLLWLLDVAGERATEAEAAVLTGWMRTAPNPQHRRRNLLSPAPGTVKSAHRQAVPRHRICRDDDQPCESALLRPSPPEARPPAAGSGRCLTHSPTAWSTAGTTTADSAGRTTRCTTVPTHTDPATYAARTPHRAGSRSGSVHGARPTAAHEAWLPGCSDHPAHRGTDNPPTAHRATDQAGARTVRTGRAPHSRSRAQTCQPQGA